MNYPAPYHSKTNGIKNLAITKLVIISTGTYNEQYIRPYSMDVRGDSLDLVKSVIDGSSVITSSMLSGISNQILRPSAQVERNVAVNNGWNERRLRFMMQIQYERGGFTMFDIVLGYTEYSGVTMNGAIDPNMRFYVNSIINQRSTLVSTPTGMQNQVVTADACHVLMDNVTQNVYQNNETLTYHMRPEDLYKVMDTASDIPSEMMDGVMDFRLITKNDPSMSRRKNNIASYYTAQMLNGYRTGVVGQYGTTEESYMNALGAVREQSIVQNAFLNKLFQLSGQHTSAFTMNDLMQIRPDIMSVYKYVSLNEVQKMSQVHAAGSTAEWHSSDIETQYASIISQTVPALMMDYGFAQLRFVSTNQGVTAQPETSILHANSFSSIPLVAQSEALKQRIDTELIRDLTYNNQISYSLTGSFDLLGESMISLSMNGGPIIDYTVPSFADALFSPVITANAGRVTDISNQFNILMGNLDLSTTAGANGFDDNYFGGGQVPTQTPVNSNISGINL